MADAMNGEQNKQRQPLYRAVCSCGWHGRAYRNGNAAWGSLDSHAERCAYGYGDMKEVNR